MGRRVVTTTRPTSGGTPLAALPLINGKACAVCCDAFFSMLPEDMDTLSIEEKHRREHTRESLSRTSYLRMHRKEGVTTDSAFLAINQRQSSQERDRRCCHQPVGPRRTRCQRPTPMTEHPTVSQCHHAVERCISMYQLSLHLPLARCVRVPG